MALNKELWLQNIQEQLFKNDSFLNTVGVDHSGYVSNITVHIPQAGSNPTISKNLSSFPAAAGSRTDADLTYAVDLYYSQPIRVGVDETQWISYDKRASVLQSHLKAMRNSIGNNTLYKWAAAASAAGSQVRTTGTALSNVWAPSATGTRLAITYKDITSAAAILDSQDVDQNDERYLIMPSALYWQMANDTNISKYLEYGASPVVPSGKIPMISGFKIIVRSSVVVYDNATAPAVIKTVGDTGVPSSPAATDNLACLAISSSYVSKATGAIEVYTKDKDPMYYGDIVSTSVAFGASKMRTSGEGVVAIIQAN
jgi:hypothetical protein